MRHPRATVAVVLLLVTACSVVGSAPALEVRAEDLRVNTRIAYETAMAIHYKISQQESPAVYKSMEALRVGFPPAHKAYVGALDGYQAVKGKNPEELRTAALTFLDGIGNMGNDEWKAQIAILRLAFVGR